MVRNVVPVFDMILFDEKGWGYFILNFNTNVNCYNKTFYVCGIDFLLKHYSNNENTECDFYKIP